MYFSSLIYFGCHSHLHEGLPAAIFNVCLMFVKSSIFCSSSPRLSPQGKLLNTVAGALVSERLGQILKIVMSS